MRLVRAACALAAAVAVAPASADAAARTWYVRAGTPEDGRGTRSAPFSNLAAVESASHAGDRIVVLPAPRSVPPLDGGIRLKLGQVLVGAGPRVGTAATRDRSPRVANTGRSRLDGDAVRLATAATVRNVEIAAAARGGIYGLNVRSATIAGNDVHGHNSSCARGFHIPPFSVPTIVRGLGIPIREGLHNGWAGIMVDVSRGRSRVGIRGNRVHDSDCGDGIDVRSSGTANVRATILANHVSELRQGEALESVLAFGLQTRDRARLVARLDDNRQSGLGNDEDSGVGPGGADSEGIFVNPSGPSSMRVAVTRNRYTHTPGRGGFSANGLEYVAMGSGPRARLDVRDSSFTGTSGDVLEQFALGTDARLSLRLDRVVATGSTGHGGSGIGDTLIIPGNNADCLIGASGGARNRVELVVRRSTLSDCANNGLTFGSAVANGSGPTAALRLDVADSTITGNHGGNLRIGNVAGLDELAVRVERTNLSGSRGIGSSPANLTAQDLGTTGRPVIDLGGGPLGSRGGNCLGGGRLAALLLGYDVHARGNWWGRPGGSGLGRSIALGATLDAGAALDARPRGC
jgi:hypothetical protein